MTTIAYRNGVLAADTGFSNGATMIAGIVKIARRADGVLAAGAGEAGFNQEFMRWFLGEREDMPTPTKDDGNFDRGVIFHPDGRLELFEWSGRFEAKPDYYAMGSGRDQALGALFAGADAETAVRAAIAHDAYTMGEVTVLRHVEEPAR